MRKTPHKTDTRVSEAMEEWKSVTEIRYEIATEALEAQDDATKDILWRIVKRLRLGATGLIELQLNPPHGGTVTTKVEQKYLDMNLLYVATEILKDLALFDIRIGTYKLPKGTCISCGAELAQENKARRRG